MNKITELILKEKMEEKKLLSKLEDLLNEK